MQTPSGTGAATLRGDDLFHWQERLQRAENDRDEARAQARRYRDFFELSAAGQAVLSLDGRYLEVNDSLCRITGYTADELLARHWQDITHPDDLAASLDSGRSMAHGMSSTTSLEKRYVRADGRTIWILLTVSLVRHREGPRQGKPSHFVAMMQDITERKEAERHLVAREALLSSMGKFVPGIIHKVGFTPEGRAEFLYISDRAMEMFELPPEQMAGDYYAHHVRVHPDDLPVARRMARPPRPGQPLKPVDFEYRVVLPGKGLRHYGGRALPVEEPDGRVVWYGHTADVTDQKQLQEARLAARVAEDANRAKSEFLSRMSHELRTPLNAVIGFAQLLRMDPRQPLSEGQRSKVALIEKAGGHLLAVISDVLDLSRIEVGGLPLSVEALPAAPCVAEAVSMVDGMAREAGITVQVRAADPRVQLLGDKLRLRQILVNLLSNAIKYNRPRGQVDVRVRREGDMVALEVADTGIGLTTDQQAHLFESFNRLGAERSGIEGTGIGLVIVQRLAELMRGRIDVHSRPGAGSRFVVLLPAVIDDTEAPASSAAADADTGTGAQQRSFTVMYAEDNDVNVDLVRKVLELRPTCRLLVARSGAEALAMAVVEQPDLLLVDMHLGDMDGFELMDGLDRLPHLAGVPRVAFSADAMPDQIHKARTRGFVGYLTKPLDIMALLRCVDEHMGPPATAAAVSASGP